MAINSITGNTLLESGMFPPCRVATTGPITASGLQTVDGVALNAGDRVLVWQQADATTNGIYAASTGTWARTSDANSNAQFFDGMLVAIAAGASYAGIIFQCTCTDDPVVVGTSLLTFAEQSTIQAQQQSATSTTAATVGVGSVALATQSGKSFAVNQWVLVYDAGGNAMLGQITAYANGALTVSVVATSGSGSHADWTIVLTNSPAAAGLMPPIGTGNVTGAGASTAGHIVTFADGTGKVLSDSDLVAGALASRSQLLYGDAAAASIPQAALVSGAAPLPYCAPQPADNLHLSNDVTNAARDINVSPGRCRDDSDLTNLQLAAGMAKRLDLAWSAGGAIGASIGGCDTGSKDANQTWHVFLIGRLNLSVTSVLRTSNVATVTAAGHGLGVGGTVRVFGAGGGFDGLAAITAVTANTFSYANTGADAGATAVTAFADGFDLLASQSYTAPTLPSGWSARQCLGSFLTDSSANVRAMQQYGDEFIFKTPSLSAAAGAGEDGNIAVGVPLGVRVKIILNLVAVPGNSVNQSVSAYLNSPEGTDQAPNNAGSPGAQIFVVNEVNATTIGAAGQVSVWTDTNAQIHVSISGAGTLYIVIIGWRDPRRRLF